MLDVALDREISAYNDKLSDLMREHLYKWVVFYDGQFSGAFEDFQDAASEAAKRFGRGPYLIRQVGAPPVTLPASLQYRVMPPDVPR